MAAAIDALERMLADPGFREGVVLDHLVPGRPAVYAPMPDLPAALLEALRARGMAQLYSHQAETYDAVQRHEDVVVVTPTASGKTLCYNVPVLARLLREPAARALYLFPTKALAQDQLAVLTEVINAAGGGIKTFTYDGDTPPSARLAIREAGQVVVTNPDMLHAAILPHHTKWLKLFQNLEFVVIDELHAYRGVFGSHLGNVVRRLRRVCQFYGSNPTFICASATIGNPVELAEKVLERRVRLVDRNGAPAAEKRLVFYNPPLVNRELGLRRSSFVEAQRIALRFLDARAQTIVFGRTRLQVELMLSYLKEATEDRLGRSHDVRGYRGGYLPSERREIERGLRSGHVRGVVATNALELGIDVGQMQAAVLCGYPGSIASTWQQLGRAGRRDEPSAGVLVCSSSPVDQFLARHPEYFLGASPEHGLVDPDNLLVRLGHLQASVFEVPFPERERFGEGEAVDRLLALLEEQGQVFRSEQSWYWSSDIFPAAEVSLRSVLAENVVIIDVSGVPRGPGREAAQPGGAEVIGEMDQFSAQTLLHDQAIYIHEGRQYHVDRLDWKEKKAYVRPIKVDHYTDADRSATVEVLEQFEGERAGRLDDSVPPPAGGGRLGGGLLRGFGEVQVTSLVTMFKKIRLHTHETIGQGPVDLPPVDLHATSYWTVVPPGLATTFPRLQLQAGLHGLAHALRHVASVHAMCDPRDLGVATQIRSAYTGGPTIFLYDAFPGGVGLSRRLFGLHDTLLAGAAELIETCACAAGCPSCVGAMVENGADAKVVAPRLAQSRPGPLTPAPVPALTA